MTLLRLAERGLYCEAGDFYTFGLPIYRWAPDREVFEAIRAWWRHNREQGRASIPFAYALGKAQRLLAGLADAGIGPVYTHGAVERLNATIGAWFESRPDSVRVPA